MRASKKQSNVQVTLDLDQVRTNLLKRRDELLGRLGKLERNLRRQNEPLSSDSKEQATQLENDEVLDALDDAARAEMAMLRATLDRLDAGSYGQCVACGKSINPRRMEVMPYAVTCIKCAS